MLLGMLFSIILLLGLCNVSFDFVAEVFPQIGHTLMVCSLSLDNEGFISGCHPRFVSRVEFHCLTWKLSVNGGIEWSLSFKHLGPCVISNPCSKCTEIRITQRSHNLPVCGIRWRCMVVRSAQHCWVITKAQWCSDTRFHVVVSKVCYYLIQNGVSARLRIDNLNKITPTTYMINIQMIHVPKDDNSSSGVAHLDCIAAWRRGGKPKGLILLSNKNIY